MIERFRIEGRCALVTGASSGLGRHFAGVLAAAGAAVALVARRRDLLEELADNIKAKGGRAFALDVDVRDPTAVAAAVTRIEGEFQPIDILVNNSGVTRTRPLLQQTVNDWQSVIATNLDGSWYMAQAVARAMVTRGAPGVIINIASVLGLHPAAAIPAYVASKAALIRLTEAMAIELTRHSIRVNALAPGYINTELNRSFFETDAGKALVKRIPQRRLGQLEELEAPLLLLASDASSFMTGSTLVVDGGHAVASL